MAMDIHGYMAMSMHVLLTDHQRAFLLNESARSGLPMAELVRRALDATYPLAPRQHVGGFEVSVGLWRRLDAAVSGRRLRQLG
jgi:hypothetical protein